MYKIRKILAVVYLFQWFTMLAIWMLRLFPITLRHTSSNNVSVVMEIDSLKCFVYRMPRYNVNLTDKEITDAVSLPEGSVVFDQLLDVAKCKAAKIKINEIDQENSYDNCLCLKPSWPFSLCGIIVLGLIYISQTDVCLYTNKWMGIEAMMFLAAIKLIFGTIVPITYTMNIETLDGLFFGTVRYALPNGRDRDYFQFPTIWIYTAVAGVVYGLICIVELAILSYAKQEKADERTSNSKSKNSRKPLSNDEEQAQNNLSSNVKHIFDEINRLRKLVDDFNSQCRRNENRVESNDNRFHMS